MMTLFLQIVTMSITASWLVMVIALIRLIFLKAPKSIICFLWLFVAIRLVLPFSFESSFSLIPSMGGFLNVVENQSQNMTKNPMNQDMDQTQIVITNQQIPSEMEEMPALSENRSYGQIETERLNEFHLMDVLPWVWLIGILMMTGYASYSYQKIYRQVAASVNTEKNIWICDDLSSPFILGIIHPKIYLPSYLEKNEMKYVLAHEYAHLKRCDHLWKPLGYVLLSIHWFNPVMWAAYLLLCSDIELACDEKVIKTLGEEYKQDYSKTLLSCSVPRAMILSCPLAFGEVSVKQRVKSVLSYKKPTFWVLAAGLCLCLALPVFFLSDPLTDEEIIENNTIHFLEKLGEFAKEFDTVNVKYTELYEQRVTQSSEILSQNEHNQIAQEISDETYGVFLDEVKREFSFMAEEQIQSLLYNRMFSWPFNEEYIVVFEQVKTYENSWASIGYAIFENEKWRFDCSWVKEGAKIKASGFTFKRMELTDEDIARIKKIQLSK